MADVITFQRFWQRRDTAANWTAANPTLADGEFGYETDTSKLKIGDGSTVWNSLAYRIDEAPIDGQEYARKDGDWIVATGGSGGDSFAADAYILREDFDRGFAESTATGTSFVTNEALPVVYVSTTGITTYGASRASAQGVLALGTGTSTTGQSNVIVTAGKRIVVGGGEMRLRYRFRVPTLSDGTNSFSLALGLRDVITGAATDQIDIAYTHGTNSGRWQLRTRASGVLTTVNGTVGPVANTDTTLELVVNAAGSSVELFADGVSMGTSSTNIPTLPLAFMTLIAKSAGTTARTIEMDLMQIKQTLTTAR
jgi:hypothetical protein